MRTEDCKQWFLPVLAITIIYVKLSSGNDGEYIYGQVRPDDPHACFWFNGPTGLSVFRCCDGYNKVDGANLPEKCIECPSGTFGFFCNKNCTCENGGKCNKVDGSCHCSAEYFGSSCQYSCNCQNGGTCMLGGSCSCADRFYGALCEKECLCPENSMCDSVTGECICKKGFYGSLCLPCNCSEKEECDRFDGDCSCSPGYYGDGCDKKCSCFNGARCGNGHSDSCKCPTGWTGAGCTDCDTGFNGLSFCKERCLHCYNGHVCSVGHGDCECSPGWQGKRCDIKCDEGYYGRNCSEECHCEHGTCDYVTGMCQCERGWTGQFCNQTCHENCVLCKGNVCLSCKAGWTGEWCTNTCKLSFYGIGCKERCPQCNCTTSCHHIDGNCPDIVRCEEQKCKYKNGRVCTENPFTLECQDQWTGHLCTTKTEGENVIYSDNTTESSMGYDDAANTNRMPTWIVIVVVVVVVVLVLIMVKMVCMARQYKSVQKIRRQGRTPRCSERARGIRKTTSDSGIDRSTSTSTQFVAIPETIIDEKDDNLVSSNETQRKEGIPVYASVMDNQKGRKQSDAMGRNNSETEAVDTDAFIQTPRAKSIFGQDVMQTPCEGPHEIVRLDKVISDSNLRDSEKGYDVLDGLRYAKQYKDNNASNDEYELLNCPVHEIKTPSVT